MTTATLSTFFALLSFACWAATFATLVLWLGARVRPASAAAGALDAVGDVALWGAWVVAAVTMAGSLYYSEAAHFLPCELCWYQRICMYPLAIVLLVAAATRDRRVWRYVVGPAGIGAIIAMYHTQLQAYPAQKTFCSTINPCTTRYVWEFGFVSLPFMALAAFAFILTMVAMAGRRQAGSAPTDRGDHP